MTCVFFGRKGRKIIYSRFGLGWDEWLLEENRRRRRDTGPSTPWLTVPAVSSLRKTRLEFESEKQSGDAGGVLGGWRGFGLAAEDEAAAFAALVGGVVNLLPEADEVVDGGDDGDDGHPVDGGDGDEVDADDVASAEVREPDPVVPAVSQDGGDDGDDLDDGLELADLAGFDGEAFGGGDGAQPGDEELAADDEDGDPWLDDAGVVADEDDVAGGDKELVCQWVEEHAHGGDLVAAAGEVAVEAIGDAGKDEDETGDDLLLAAAEAGGAVAPPGEGGREDPDEQRNAGNAAHRDGVGQVHERVLRGTGVVGVRGADTSILP
jgi:hypothetical protein